MVLFKYVYLAIHLNDMLNKPSDILQFTISLCFKINIHVNHLKIICLRCRLENAVPTKDYNVLGV